MTTIMKEPVAAPLHRSRQESMWLAWADWQIRIPLDWRPLMMHGTHREGSMMLGTGNQAILNFKWWQPPHHAINTDRWVRERLKKIAPTVITTPHPAAPLTDFQELAWLPPSANGTSSKALWYGQALSVPLLVECVLNLNAAPHLEHDFFHILLPSLRVQKPDDYSRWAVFNVSFISPVKFELKSKRLFPGDMMLWFATPQREQLMVRQIYPIDLALQRMGMVTWLTRSPNKEYLKFITAASPAAWEITRNGRSWQGLKRTGYKRLPFPLQNWRARYSQAAIVQDTRLDRLLVAEYDSLQEMDDTILQNMIMGMNWAIQN